MSLVINHEDFLRCVVFLGDFGNHINAGFYVLLRFEEVCNSEGLCEPFVVDLVYLHYSVVAGLADDICSVSGFGAHQRENQFVLNSVLIAEVLCIFLQVVRQRNVVVNVPDTCASGRSCASGAASDGSVASLVSVMGSGLGSCCSALSVVCGGCAGLSVRAAAIRIPAVTMQAVRVAKTAIFVTACRLRLRAALVLVLITPPPASLP